MGENGFKFTKRHLPHRTSPGATYFITFRTKETELSADEINTVINHIKAGAGSYYDLYATVVMPDHVHLLLSPKREYELKRIMKGIKGASARRINKTRGTSGSIWQDESFDRIIRNEDELIEKLNYMFNNPLKKELVEDPNEYLGWYLNEELL